MTVLSLDKIVFSGRAGPIVDKVSFAVEAGDFFVIIGPNGAGKTTLLKIISGLVPAQQGTVTVLDRPLTAYSRRQLARLVALVYILLGALFLMVLLSVSSPFKLLPIMPDEGRGLNPLLRNFWMIIHPPIVFVGYVKFA